MPYPPATAGDAVYSRGMIEALAAHASVTVLCADSGSAHQGHAQVEWHITDPERSGRKGSVLSRWPLIAWKGAQRAYHDRLNKLLERQWDTIVVDNIGTAHAMPKLLAYRRLNPGCALVHFSHEHEYNARSKKYGAYGMGIVERLATQWDLFKVKRVEDMLVRDTNLVTVLNSDDEKLYRNIAPTQRYLMQTPGYDGTIAVPRKIDSTTPRRLLLLGGRRSAQKQQVLLDWLESGHATLSEAGVETQIIGDMPDRLRDRLARDYPDLKVLGFVDDPAPLIAQARAGLIVDTLGGGFKLRLLSHVFNRLPIIGLADAIEGLPVEADQGYLAAQDHPSLAHLVLEAIDDFPRLNGIMNAAFDACDGKFSWDSRATQLVAALGDIAVETPAQRWSPLAKSGGSMT
jgi:polysaccharide biosynthesis protein PslH